MPEQNCDVPIPRQWIQRLALIEVTRYSSIPRPKRRLNVTSIAAETVEDLESLGQAGLIRPEVEGPVEDAMAGEARIYVRARLVVFKVDVVLRVDTATAIEAAEVSGAVEAHTMAIRTVVTSHTVRVN